MARIAARGRSQRAREGGINLARLGMRAIVPVLRGRREKKRRRGSSFQRWRLVG